MTLVKINKGHNSTSCKDLFEAVVLNVDSIFETYHSLHDLYSTTITTLEDQVNNLPQNFINQVSRFKQVLDTCKSTVGNEQEKISSRLYEQGLVLLVGSSESILRETFRTLVEKNLSKVTVKPNVAFTFEEVMGVFEGDSDLPGLVLAKLEDEKNPAEKLNFQNVKQMQGIFESYFVGFKFPDSIEFEELHKYWQIRHIIIHNRGMPDQKFITNLQVVGLDTSKYKLGKKIKIEQRDYEECKHILETLFLELDAQINKRDLIL
jgi:hypothetical protein